MNNKNKWHQIPRIITYVVPTSAAFLNYYNCYILYRLQLPYFTVTAICCANFSCFIVITVNYSNGYMLCRLPMPFLITGTAICCADFSYLLLITVTVICCADFSCFFNYYNCLWGLIRRPLIYSPLSFSTWIFCAYATAISVDKITMQAG